MEITMWQMYWLTRLASFNALFGLASVVFGVGFIFTLIHVFIEDRDRFLPIVFACLMVLFGVITALVPTTKEVAAIWAIPKIMNNEKAHELPDKVLTLANEWIEEMRPKGEKK